MVIIFFIVFFMIFFLGVYIIKRNLRIDFKYDPDVYEKFKDMAFDILENDPEICSFRRKKNYQLALGILIIIFSIGGLLSIPFFYPKYISLLFVTLIIGFIIAILTNRYNSVLSDKLLPSLIRYYNKDLVIDNSKKVSLKDYHNISIYSDDIETINCICGEVQKSKYCLYDIITYYMCDKDDHGKERQADFMGGLCIVDLNKKCDFDLKIYYSYNPKEKENSSKFMIDNSEFEKHFDVTTSDEMEAMKFLTPDIADNFLRMYEIYGIPMDIYISGYKMYIRFRMGNLFDINFGKINDEANSLALSISKLDACLKSLELFVKIYYDWADEQ